MVGSCAHANDDFGQPVIVNVAHRGRGSDFVRARRHAKGWRHITHPKDGTVITNGYHVPFVRAHHNVQQVVAIDICQDGRAKVAIFGAVVACLTVGGQIRFPLARGHAAVGGRGIRVADGNGYQSERSPKANEEDDKFC